LQRRNVTDGRLGFLIAPASLQPALHAAKQLTDWHGELATQAALARFIDEGLLARHIRKVAREYAERYVRVTDSLEKRCGRWLQLIPAAAGMHVTAKVVPGTSVDTAQLVRRAEERGVEWPRFRTFTLERPGGRASSSSTARLPRRG